MRVWRNLVTAVAGLFRRERVSRELDEELAGFLEASAAEKRKRGMSASEARRAAKVEMGSSAAVKQAVHVERPGSGFESFLQDLRFAVRTLRRERGFTAIAVLILGLGIGANVAVFSVVDTLVLRPLPFRDAGRLVWLEPGKNLDPKLREAGGLGAKTFDVDDFEAFQRTNKSFESVTNFNPFVSGGSEYTLTGSGEPQGVAGVMVAGNFFQTLGVQPELGRLFTAEELSKGGRAAVLLSNAFWRRQFMADRGIVGRAIELSGKPVTVVGVMPASFDFGAVFMPGRKFDVYTPAVMDEMRNWGNSLSAVGRLRPGVTLAHAQAESDLLFAGIRAANMAKPGGMDFDFSPTLTGLKEYVSGSLRRSLMVLWLAVAMVLLIVCVNLSNMLMSRALSRAKEFALRAALGAGRGRLIRQLLTESLVLAAAGAVLGLGMAYGVTYFVAHSLANQETIALPLLREVRVDGVALGWTVLLVLLVAVVFGLASGLRLSLSDLQGALKDGGGHGTSSGGRNERLRSAMVVAEIALSCMLLVGAGLLLRSFWNTLRVDMGFDAESAATMRIDYAQGADGVKRGVVLQEIIRRVETIPGVTSAGVADMLPLGRNRSWMFWPQEHPPQKGDITVALTRIVTPGYLGAMGMRLRAGRDFTWQDLPERKDKATGAVTGQNVVIVNQAAARRFWPGENPLGKMAVLDGGDSGAARVVGVLDDVREMSLEAAPAPEMYLPVMQDSPEGAELVIRSTLPAGALSGSVLAALRAVNPAQPAYPLEPLESVVDRSVSPKKFFLVLVLSFAGLGLVLAALGIYGVIAYSVTQRTQEIGIRMALGATAQQVERSVMGKTMRLALVGLAVGTVASLLLARGMEALLYGTGSADPATYLGMAALLVAVAGLAGYLPARRAARINPAVALRM